MNLFDLIEAGGYNGPKKSVKDYLKAMKEEIRKMRSISDVPDFSQEPPRMVLDASYQPSKTPHVVDAPHHVVSLVVGAPDAPHHVVSLTCKRCQHSWIPRIGQSPKKCPSCQSRIWNR